MAECRHLSSAPITEAVVDLRVRFEDSNAERDLERLESRIKAEFPKKKQRLEMRVEIGPDKDKPGSKISSVGFLFYSADDKHVVQCKPDGFGFSRLAPYGTWDELITAAWGPWEQYRDEFGPSRVVRISSRFINKLPLPGNLDFDDYLTVAPRLPPNVPQQLSAFSSAVVIPNVAEKMTAIVRTNFDSAGIQDNLTFVILDIDTVTDCDLAPNDDSGIRKTIDRLRMVKNDLFFGSLTDKAVELFK